MESISKSDENVNKEKLCSGFGQYHTARKDADNPKPYTTITLADIAGMLESPPSLAKESAQWVIFSNRLTRVHAEQRENGRFCFLWADIDKVDGLSFEDIFSRSGGVIDADFLLYTTKSATKDNPKSRIIIPLLHPVSGEMFVILQTILNNGMEAAGITPDRATERAGQVCYLPNKGEFYQFVNSNTKGPFDPIGWAEDVARIEYQLDAEKEDLAERQALAHAKAAERVAAGTHSPMDAYKASYSTELALAAFGYVQRGSRWISPNSESGTPGVIIKGDKWISSHSSDSGIGMKTSNGTMGDAFDLFKYYSHGNDQDAALKAAGEMFRTVDGVSINKANQREYMRKESEKETLAAFEGMEDAAEPSEAALKLAKEIESSIAKALGIDAEDEAIIASLGVNPQVIDRMITGSFWSGQKSKLYLLNHSGDLNQYQGKDAYLFLAKTFGRVVDAAKVRELAEAVEFEGSPGDKKKFVNYVCGIHQTAIMNYLKYYNQRDAVEWRVDMFSKHNRMELRPDVARLILPHKPFVAQGKRDDEVVKDFKEHFKRFDILLTFIVMARFVLDRKKAYLWLKASSDWGKGFLLGILKAMGCSVETSMKEIEKMLEGSPSGRSPKDFKRAFVFVIDEFKTVKSELKQLQSEITLAPKNQLACSVEVFAKLFLSAESVASLVGEYGIEDQFANRMSIFEETGSIIIRPMYKAKGTSAYFNAILAYTVEQINRQVAEMQKLGKAASELKSERWLDDFIKNYGLDTKYQRLSKSLPDLAEEIEAYWREWLHLPYIITTEKGTFIKSTGKALEDFLEEHFDKSQITSLRKKKEELLKLISHDGKGPGTQRTGKGEDEVLYGIRLKDWF